MTNNEIITLSISAGALLISLVTLYLSFFHRKIAVVGTLLQMNYKNDKKYDLELEYSFGNIGNQQVLLKEAEVLIGKSARGKDIQGYSVGDVDYDDIPSVIDQREVKIFKISIKSTSIKDAKENGEKCFVTFNFVSPAAKSFEVFHDISALRDHRTKEEQQIWKSFNLGKSIKI